MELDERLHWFGTRVTSSLKPRAEELKNLFSNEESRRSLLEFCNNEESRHLYISFFGEKNRNLVASFKASPTLQQKTLLFIKSQNAAKITRDNINDDVFYCSCSANTIRYLDIITKEVFLPLLSIEQTGGVSADKMMDVIHRLMSCLQIAHGSIDGEVNLPLPSIEVLSEAAGYGHRKLAVIHILETFLIGWIKQIKISLKLEPEVVIARHHGSKPGPLCEADAWSKHLEKIHSLNEQLCSPVIVNILMNLEEANSTYAQSFHNVKREIAKAEMEADENLQFLSTMSCWFQALSSSSQPSELIPNFAPLMHTLYLVWQHSRYYHKLCNLTRLLKMISNEVVQRARILVGDNVLDDLFNAHSHLKEALQICASFRGRYLDTKDKADILNQQKLAEQIGRRTDSVGIVWHSRLFKEARTQRGGNVFNKEKDQKSEHAFTELTWDDSPWPARNSAVFAGLNSFMERCNDVLELVDTTRHFRMLRHAAEVGGAGGRGLDAMVREIHEEFENAMRAFKSKVKEVLNIDETQHFERGFFIFRSVIRELESRLGGVLKESFKQCWDIRSKLRLLEVFEGTSSRELVQVEIDDTVSKFVGDLTTNVIQTKEMFEKGIKVTHHHIPPLANELLWLHSLKARLKVPIEKLKLVSPASLKGDEGWKLRDMYSDFVKDVDKAEATLFKRWQNTIGEDLRLGLKKPLLTSCTSDEGFEILCVNMDKHLEEILKEVQYLQRPPFELRLPDSIRSLIRNTDPAVLQTNAARLETVVYQYNSIIRTISEIEKPLFEAKIMVMEQLLKHGLHNYTWKDVESTDFIEQAANLVCNDAFRNIEIVRGNFAGICKISESWSSGDLDAFGSVDHSVSLYISELNATERSCCEELWHSVETGGAQIHELLQSTFEAVKISRASPAWQRYTDQISNIVYEGLRKSILKSLNSMLHRISLSQEAEPILTIRLELIASEITFSPPLHPSSAAHSLKEYVADWLQWYLLRASYVASIASDENFKELVSVDPEVLDIISRINKVVEERISESEKYLDTFKEFAFLWLQDVRLTFDEFLKGNISSRARAPSRLEEVKSSLSNGSKKEKDTQRSSSRASSAITTLNSIAMGTVALTERTMMAVKRLKLSKDDNAPSLDDFDREIDVYRNSRDEIHAATESVQAGWIKVNMQPIKKTIETYARKWVFTFTKYLSDQVSSALNDLDAFLKRIEPGVEAITGEERDIVSFMRLMRIFNEVTAQQSELDTKFATMKKTISLLEKYEQKLPETTQKFYSAAPIRWNNLKMKVNQAKQRLGPRIQAEADNVSKTLHDFGERCKELDYEFRSSEAFNRSCLIYTAHSIMDSVEKRLCIIESEAQDLVELQELLEKEVADFSILPSLRSDLGILRNVWETVKLIKEQQNDWKRHRWQKIKPKLLRKLLIQQEDLVKQLPEKAFAWDVTIGVTMSIEDMMSCIPIMEDLSKAAMRTRHWKQLVRATGGAVNISSGGLTKMTLGQFLELGLQNHAEEVRGVIQRSSKDVGIEKTLKTYEEVWLSKTFELIKHTRLSNLTINSVATLDTPASEFGNDSEHGPAAARQMGSRVSLASMGLRTESRLRLTSISNTSVQQSSLMSMAEMGDVYLLKNIEPILEELELHQLSLQSMFGGSAASSFTDDIVKWQKTLQNLEAVLVLWWEVQKKWVKLDDIYNGNDCRVGLPKETNLFAASSYDFRDILKATEKNPNVLQICSKENIYTRLEKMNSNFEICLKALFNHLDRRKQKFPRLYLVSPEDVMDIVCKGYDPGQVNPHLCKILHNACLMDYDLQENEDRHFYRITGVRSLHGEILKFVKPVDCDSAVEIWLNSVLSAIKTTLQVALASALGMPLPENLKLVTKTSSESTIPVKSESKAKKTESTQRKVLFAPETEVVKELDDAAHVEINLPSSWSLRNVNEVVILALQIELTKKFEKSFEELHAGSRNAIDDLREHLSTILQSAAKILQGVGFSDPLHEVIDDSVDARKDGDAGSNEKQREERENIKERRYSEAHADPQMVLLPSQIQKLTNLIFILSSKRDLAKRLSELLKSIDENQNDDKKPLKDTFEWRSHIKYYWSEANASCKVSIMDYESDYGFEYQGTTARMISTPETDRAFFWLSQGFTSNISGLIVGPSLTGKKETVLELSNTFGYPLFSFLCSEKLNTRRIGEIFKGIAATGSWCLFQNIDKLSGSAMSVIGQLMSAVSESLQAKKSTVFIQDEEQSLSANAKLFATVNLNINIDNNTVQKAFPCITSTLFSLPGPLLEKFRTVCISKPDVSTILNLHLIIHGFKFSEELAKNLASIHSLWSTLSTYSYPASIRAMCNVIADAGDYRDKLKVSEGHGDVDVIYEREVGDESERGSLSPAASELNSEEQKEENLNDGDLNIEKQEATIATEKSPGDIENQQMKYIEEKSILLAIRGSVSPSLCGADAVMFATIISDYFPSIDVPLVFDNEKQQENNLSIGDDTIGFSLEKEEGAPLKSLPSSPQPKDQAVSDFESAVRIAVDRLDLQPGSSFVGRVVQLAQLTATQKTVLVVGPSGSGKTECIRTLIAAQREMGRNVIYDSIYLGMADSENLFGYTDTQSGLFRDGLLPTVLRRKLHELCKSEFSMSSTEAKDMRWIHLDGMVDSAQMYLLSTVLSGNDTVILPNSERFHLPTTVRFIWEIDSLENISPSIIRNSGILNLDTHDVGWELVMQNWLSKQHQSRKDTLSELCFRYIQPTLDFLLNEKVILTSAEHKKSVVGYNHPRGQLQHVVSLPNLVLVRNLFSIFEALISNAQDPTIDNFENYFNFSCFWAFGGNLIKEHREHFSDWWSEKWKDVVLFPADASIWECQVHPETHELVHVSEILPSYSGQPNVVFPADAHVVTVQNMVLSHLVGALAESGKPTLLIGPSGCGKSHIIKERLLNNSSEMAEVQSLFINSNKFITSTTLWQRMNDYLEWKHTKTYVPKGNKKLICLIDDLNDSNTSTSGNQSACEMMRQILDHKGSFYYDNWKWREIHDVTYLATYNPWTTSSTSQLSKRFLNKWVVIYNPFPSQKEQQSIYGTLLKTHFILSNSPSNQENSEEILSSEILRKQKAEEDMKMLLESIVGVTVEVQGNLRRMFLPTPDRCHYMFTLNNLNMIFRNLCLAIGPNCKESSLLLLWKHECENIHGSLFFDKVDKDRWMQLLYTSARKRLSKNQLEILSQPSILVSNAMDMDDSTKKGTKSSSASSDNEEQNNTSYKPVKDISKTRAILEHNITEYNKDNPKVKIYLYESTIKVICRLTRILQSPHECGHSLILAEGFPGLPLSLVKISAYICGFTVFQVQPSAVVLGEKYTTEHFKMDMVNAYTTAGLKGEKLLFVLNEMEVLDDDFLVYVAEFLVSNSISHLFNEEEHTSITNAIRTEVTQAGLNYSKETAWNFFLKTVRENLRFVFIASSLDQKFQIRCRLFPSMLNAMQTMSMPQWTKEELVGNAMYHLKDLKIFDDKEKENVAHLLASMHLSLKESSKNEVTSIKLNNITNTSYERFIEHFIDLALKRNAQVQREYGTISKALEAVERGSELAMQLKNQLEHEKLVLEQKKQGNCTLLGEIGMDKAITEEQVRLVRKQQWKIEKLERLLPRYQDAHERAVFKAAAIVKETKQVLAELDHQGLADLRAMQKPDSDVEDVLAAVIIIVKSPTSDLTWNKGAKRIMANLERFREEIAAFDEVELTEGTLQVVEPYTKRPHFMPGYMEKKTGNSALESLVLWSRGVVKYHRMMLSRVKPLHIKVEQTSKALEEAVDKLGGMENKLKNLDNRMVSLSGKFVDASVDKSRQGILTVDQKMQLKRAAYFEKLLARGTEQWTKVLNSICNRRNSMVGSVAISAGFATYLGVYHYGFRRKIIEKVWPDCLKERGIIVDINIGNSLTVDITMSVASEDSQHVLRELEKMEDGENNEQAEVQLDGSGKADVTSQKEIETVMEESEIISQHDADADYERASQTDIEAVAPSVSSENSIAVRTENLRNVKKFMDSGGHQLYAYENYCLAVLVMLTGNKLQQTLVTKGINYRELEDLAIIIASVQTPLLIIDPYNIGMKLLSFIKDDMVKIDMSQKESTILSAIEKSITAGDTLVIYNIEDQIDSCLFPIIAHINTKCRLRTEKEPSVIKMNGRRLLIQPTFQLILIHKSPLPEFPQEIASTTTIIDLRPHTAGIVRYFQMRGLTRIMPDLSMENNKTYFRLFRCLALLEKLDANCMSLIRGRQGSCLWEETEMITDLVRKRSQMTSRFASIMSNLQLLQCHRAGFIPLANCVLSAFNITHSLSALRYEYQFPIGFMISLFDVSVGGENVEISDEFVYTENQDGGHDMSMAGLHANNSKESLNKTELLGVNVDQIKLKLTAESKDFANHKDQSKDSDLIDHAEAGSVIDLPEEIEQNIPSLEDDLYKEIPEISKKFFTIFFKHVSKALDPNHQKLFTALCWLHIDSIDFKVPESNVIDLLLSENDFVNDSSNKTSDKPQWMSDVSWNRLLSFSKQISKLNEVLQSITQNESEWLQWYESSVPESICLPIIRQDGEELENDNDTSSAQEKYDSEDHQSSPNDEFDQEILKLLVIKCLRPDRFGKAFLEISLKRLGNLQETTQLKFNETLSCTNSSSPVLILLNSKDMRNSKNMFEHTNSSSRVADLLSKKAEEKDLSFITVSVFDDNERVIDLSLNNAISTGGWILIENLHLGKEKWLKQFAKRVARLQDQSYEAEQWRIFLTTEPSDKTPLQLLHICEKVSVDTLYAVLNGARWTIDDNNEDIKNNVISAIKSTDIWLAAKDGSLIYRNLLYLLCIIHGLIISRLKYVPKTFTSQAPVDNSDLATAIECVNKFFANQKENISLSVDRLCSVICENIYCSKLSSDSDQQYIKMLFECLKSGISTNHGSTVDFGKWCVAVPPANIDPTEYDKWFVDKLEVGDGNDCTINALSLGVHVSREYEEQRSNDFVNTLRHLYNISKKELFSERPAFTSEIDTFKVRQVIDQCKDHLPPLLKIDENFGMSHSQIRLNPQLRSLTPLSEKSLLLNQNEELASSLSFCLLKECQAFNASVYKISSCIQELDEKLVSGIHAIPRSMKSILNALNANRVPDKWLTGYCRTTQETLSRWIEGHSKAYTQLNSWLKRGSVPKPNTEPTVGYGYLEAVDLSLLVNPEALITSMKYAMALSHDVSIEQVFLKCYISKRHNKSPTLPPGVHVKDGIMLKNLYLKGASWDIDKGCLTESRNSTEKLPLIFLVTEIRLDDHKDYDCFNCPVYFNGCRQDIICTLPLSFGEHNIKNFSSFPDACILLEPSPGQF